MRDLEFRRIHDLPPYVFATVDQLKRELRREGRDVIDLGFGNPDIPSPPAAVEKLREAAAKPANHRYSASRGLSFTSFAFRLSTGTPAGQTRT